MYGRELEEETEKKKTCTNGSGVKWAQHRTNSEMCLSE